MIPELYTKPDFESVPVDADVSRWKEAGQDLGRANVQIKPRGRPASPPANRRRRLRDLIAKTAAKPQGENSTAVLDNFRLIFACEKEARTLSLRLGRFPVLVDPNGIETPRINMLAR